MGRKKRGRSGLVYDHRHGVCKDLKDEQQLRAALRDAYGDAMHWIDEDTLVDDFYDLRNDSADGKRYFLNSRTSSSDALMDSDAWLLCRRDEEIVAGEFVTLGFDGSIRDDAMALTACRVSDGHLHLLGVWEKPEGPEGEGWQVDREAVDSAVARAFDRFDVCGFYCDPLHWQDYVDAWTRDYGDDVRVRATQARPLEWWTNRPTAMEQALARFTEAVEDKGLSWCGTDKAGDTDADYARKGVTLTRHVLNAKRRTTSTRSVRHLHKSRRKPLKCLLRSLRPQLSRTVCGRAGEACSRDVRGGC
ncbi:hypothetical protein [Streptomyces sp. NPDC018352]|uniref:hypothetical protein n=1 Tax=Streptomyces sp. NPDC018352 TaxID=3157194 RepID=UPI00340551F7